MFWLDNRTTEVLQEIHRRSRIEDQAYPVSQDTGVLLSILVKAVDAVRVLEIGLGFGSSAIYMASQLREPGTIDTIEIDPSNIRQCCNLFRIRFTSKGCHSA